MAVFRSPCLRVFLSLSPSFDPFSLGMLLRAAFCVPVLRRGEASNRHGLEFFWGMNNLCA